MANGIPLTDADRWDWLRRVAATSAARALHSRARCAVATCSALKRVYRDVLRSELAANTITPVRCVFVFLHASEATLVQRCAARKGHYMGAEMVKSQLQIMELPAGDEVLQPQPAAAAAAAAAKAEDGAGAGAEKTATPGDCVLVGEQEQALDQQVVVHRVLEQILGFKIE